MKKLLYLALAIGISLIIGFLVFMATYTGTESGLAFRISIALLFIIAFFIIAFFIRILLQPTTQPKPTARYAWIRPGLLYGGVIGLYFVALQVMNALVPVLPQFQGNFRSDTRQVMVLSLTLLIGVVSMAGGYTSGKTRTGAFGGLLAVFIGLLIAQVSQILLIVLLWNTLQHHTLQSQLGLDFQFWLQGPGQTRTLRQYLQSEVNVNISNFVTILIFQAIGVPFAILSSLLGVVVRRGENINRQGTLTNIRPGFARSLTLSTAFTFSILAIGLLTWGFFATINLLPEYPFSLNELGSSFTSPAGLSWLLGFIIVLVSVFVSVPGSTLLRRR